MEHEHAAFGFRCSCNASMQFCRGHIPVQQYWSRLVTFAVVWLQVVAVHQIQHSKLSKGTFRVDTESNNIKWYKYIRKRRTLSTMSVFFLRLAPHLLQKLQSLRPIFAGSDCLIRKCLTTYQQLKKKWGNVFHQEHLILILCFCICPASIWLSTKSLALNFEVGWYSELPRKPSGCSKANYIGLQRQAGQRMEQTQSSLPMIPSPQPSRTTKTAWDFTVLMLFSLRLLILQLFAPEHVEPNHKIGIGILYVILLIYSNKLKRLVHGTCTWFDDTVSKHLLRTIVYLQAS